MYYLSTLLTTLLLSVWSYTQEFFYLNIIRVCVLNSLSYNEKNEDDKNKHFHLSYNSELRQHFSFCLSVY